MSDFLRRLAVPRTHGAGIALFRVALGLVGTSIAIGVILNADRYYGAHGLVPWELVRGAPFVAWTPFALAPDSDATAVVVGGVLALACLGLAAGPAPRAAALVAFVCAASLHHRNPFVANSGDRLFVILVGLAVFLPPVPPPWAARPPEPTEAWGLRLAQLQIAYVYAFSFLAKLGHERWVSGLALQDVLASPVYAEWPVVLGSAASRGLTWSTLAFEGAFPLLVWLRRARPWCLGAGLGFHLAIEITMTIPVFSAVMIASYALFLDDAQAEGLLGRLGRRPSQSVRGTASMASTPTSSPP